MKHLKKADTDTLRATLRAEQMTLENELSEHGVKIGGNWQGVARSEGVEPDSIDKADTMEELSINVPLVESLELRLSDVRAALKKMDEGTYGIDEKTGAPIPIARLLANPAARIAIE